MCAVVHKIVELRKTLCQGIQTNDWGIAQGKLKTLLLSTLGVFDKGGCG